MAEDLQKLLRELNEPEDPALPSLERIVAGLRQQRFSGNAVIGLKKGRIVSFRKEAASDREAHDPQSDRAGGGS